jgi:hypothetical protein
MTGIAVDIEERPVTGAADDVTIEIEVSRQGADADDRAQFTLSASQPVTLRSSGPRRAPIVV